MLPQTRGLLLALEHRYYGCHNRSSCPYADASAPGHLDYLTTDQALADLAAFAAWARAARGVRADARVVAIGGSYPGMLAAFARATYPDVFAMAVASSAPVHGVLDFTGFQDAVTAAYSMDAEGVAGSPECASAIDAGHAAALALLAGGE